MISRACGNPGQMIHMKYYGYSCLKMHFFLQICHHQLQFFMELKGKQYCQLQLKFCSVPITDEFSTVLNVCILKG